MEDITKTWETVAQKLWTIKEKLKALAEKEAHLADQLRTLSGNKTFSSGGYAYIMNIRKGSVDYRSIPELKSVDIERYRKADTTFWKLEKIA